MRHQDSADLATIDTGDLHVGRQVGGVRLPLADTRSSINHDMLVADLEHDDR